MRNAAFCGAITVDHAKSPVASRRAFASFLFDAGVGGSNRAPRIWCWSVKQISATRHLPGLCNRNSTARNISVLHRISAKPAKTNTARKTSDNLLFSLPPALGLTVRAPVDSSVDAASWYESLATLDVGGHRVVSASGGWKGSAAGNELQSKSLWVLSCPSSPSSCCRDSFSDSSEPVERDRARPSWGSRVCFSARSRSKQVVRQFDVRTLALTTSGIASGLGVL